MAAGAAGLAVLVGGATVTNTGDWSSWGRATLPLGAGFLLAALTEEFAFRGYPLRRLAAAVGAGPATTLGAIGFGLAHLGNPSATAFSTVNVALAGVWLEIGRASCRGRGEISVVAVSFKKKKRS